MTRCSHAPPRRWQSLTLRCVTRCVTLAVLCSAPTLARAQTGIVVGVVTEQATGQPLEASQVSIAGTNLGAATDHRGHFIIRGVAVGDVTVRAQRLGFRPA